ncbi:MAG TPA: hypothetical protein VHY21_19890 [Pseudonocardiaceae bacterium]|jgi:hypothetical protein|nr:hypothetical protein [Pseudonocardiaceae bacterium]
MNNADQPGTGDPAPRGKRDPNRRVIDVTCVVHGGARGFVPLVVTKKDGDIELNPHVLRHEALCCIPYQVGRDLEEYLWV